MVNSRYKDLYDLYSLLIERELPDDLVVQATKNTFKHRGTSILDSPKSLSTVHWTSDEFATEWSRFLEKIGDDPPSCLIARVIEILPLEGLQSFLKPSASVVRSPARRWRIYLDQTVCALDSTTRAVYSW